MSNYLPTLKQLQYLVALQEHGHFGKAAEASFVSRRARIGVVARYHVGGTHSPGGALHPIGQ
jgi:hypothetical protein